ncbi:PAS domain-containing sensor histidine kinase [Bacillus sp. FJAT-27264]|uniref:cell wall metabolism sensor histidine kinase WalK n=1 Tax=Paenibacillus sp. (strain DSM 101736 / FJAT-27264) TaxID=1850362 RepID=UPI000807ED60|nr:cell wall metabolism sensor histidine kinase WalK [Bacillus sp. FJAT-27264]OBZ08312.1 PAS domain-containing sensor histidine kinase [Bacillus sp. FJAT-27264]
MKGLSFFRTIQAKFIIIYVLLILIAMQLIGVYFVSSMKNSLTDNFTKDLKARAEMLSILTADKFGSEAGTIDEETAVESLRGMVNNLYINGAEIQVLDASGKIITTSVPSQNDYVGQRNTQTVVSRALQGISDNEEYIIGDDNVRKKVVAKPVLSGGKVVGAIYIAADMKDLYATMSRINSVFISGLLLALTLTAVLGVIIAHTFTQPIKEMTRHATAVAEGRFNRKMPVFGNDEIGQLSQAFNYMTGRLHEALSQNEEEKEKLASILTNMSDGVVATDESGMVILMNRRAALMLGAEGPLPEGAPLNELLGLDSEQAGALPRDNAHSAMLHLSPMGGGDPNIVRVTFTPIHRREGGIAGTIAVLQDVTEQENLEESRREFVANVSHELRTPLTTIKSYAEALDDGALDDPQLAARFVGVIRNETERMIRLVTDLLHLSRLDSKEARLRIQQTDVAEMLEDVADRFSFQIRQKRINISTRVRREAASAWLDRDQIDQVLGNLVSNALKYTPEGGSIELEALQNEEGMLSISVRDSGIGIPKKDIERIFERFYRVDKARSRNMGGTGLGLSIAREIVKAHGGSISLQSEVDQGSKVTFTLPPDEQRGSEA